MKPGDIVSFNAIKDDKVSLRVQGELVSFPTETNSIVKTKHPIFCDEPIGEQEYFYDVSTASLELIETKQDNVFTQEGTIMRPKDYLESGRVVFFKKGDRGIIVSLKGSNFIMVKDKLISLQNFDEKLHCQFSKEYDIIKIAEMKEGCSFESFHTVKEEMLDIIWQENFHTIDSNKMIIYISRANPETEEELIAAAIGEIICKDFKEKTMIVKTKTQLFKEDTSVNGYYYYTIPFVL